MLVSCIMPTQNRREFIGAAIDCWLKQTYENRELVILDDGNDYTGDVIPKDERIRYAMIDCVTTGEKRNACCRLAKGEIICHFDSDDWSDPGRIASQVDELQRSGKPITGFRELYFYSTITGQAAHYRSTVPGYIVGTSFCYLRSFWEGHQFRNQQSASDNAFVYPILRQVAAVNGLGQMVARIHGNGQVGRPKPVIVGNLIPKETLPAGFWENENLRLSCLSAA